MDTGRREARPVGEAEDTGDTRRARANTRAALSGVTVMAHAFVAE
jgi:hypothetical protein